MSFYGTPPISATGTYSIQLTVRDPFGQQVIDSFDLRVNSKPAIPTSGIYGKVDKEFRVPQGFTTIRLGNYFQDIDVSQGDAITFSIR